MANLRIKLVKSAINSHQNMKDTLRTLGLRKIGQEVVREDSGAVRGAVHTVRHLVTVEEVD